MNENSSENENNEEQRNKESNISSSQNWEEAKKKIISGFNIFKEKVKEIGSTVKEKIEEKKNQTNETSENKKLIEDMKGNYPVAYCVACGNELSPELAIKLNDGNPVVCETCGIVMKKED